MLKKSMNTKQRKGFIFGSLSPLFYTLDSVLDIVMFGAIFATDYRQNLGIWEVMVYSLIITFIKDGCLFIFMNFKSKGKLFSQIGELWKNKKRTFIISAVGAISGGPLGFSLTTATILYSGAAYGSALSNFSPILVLILSRFFLNTKITKVGWTGVVLAITGFIGLAFGRAIVGGESFSINSKVFVGIILAIFAVLTWSLETFLAEYVEKLGDQSFDSDEKLMVKSVTSTPALALLIPIFYWSSQTTSNAYDVNYMLSTIFSSIIGWTVLISIGSIVTLGRIYYWKSIEGIGGGRADVLYYLTVVFTPILASILYAVNAPGFNFPDGIDEWYYWVFLTLQLVGVIIVSLTTINTHIMFKDSKKKKI